MITAKLKIYGNIGDFDPMLVLAGKVDTSTSAAKVAKFIADNSNADILQIDIKSNGGSVTHGFDIYKLLKNSGKKIITNGYKVNSIATVVFLAGDERNIKPGAEFIVHNPYVTAKDLGDLAITADVADSIKTEIKKIEEDLYKFYSDTLNLNDSNKVILKGLMDSDTNIGSEEAIKLGFATGYINKPIKSVEVLANNIAYTDLVLNIYKSKSNKQMSEAVEQRLTGVENLLNKLMINAKNWFKDKVKNYTDSLADGTVIYFSDDVLTAGSAVYYDESYATPLPDGVHELMDGRTITVVGGIVTEINAPAADASAEITALKATVDTLTAERDALKEAATASATAFETEKTALLNDVKALTTEISNIKKIVVGDKVKAKTATDNANLPAWKKRFNAEMERLNNKL